MKRFALLLVALAGCGTSPEIPACERAPSRGVFGLPSPPSSERLVDGPRVWRTYALPQAAPAEDVADVLRTLYGGVVVLDGAHLRVAHVARGHAMVASFLAALGDASRARVRCGIVAYDVPEETASTLGALEVARGAGSSAPFFLVAITTAELERLDRLTREGRAGDVWSMSAEGVSAQWLTCRTEMQTLKPAGLLLRGEPVGVGQRFVRNGLSARAACVPMTDGSRLVVFRVFESLELEAEAIRTIAFDGRTSLPVYLPGTLERRCEDAVLLGRGEAVGLVARSNRAGFVRLVVLSVTAGT